MEASSDRLRPTDPSLVRRALTHQRGGASNIHRKYLRLVRAILDQMVKDSNLAEDLAQETFFIAFHNLDRLREPGHLKAWLVGIARRVFLAHQRKARARVCLVPASSMPVEAEPVEEKGRLAMLEERLHAHDFREVVEGLPEPYRGALVKRFYEEVPFADLAQAQGISLSLAKYRVRRGLRLLQEALAEAGFIEGESACAQR